MKLSKELSYNELIESLNEMGRLYSNMNLSYIGQSVFERTIPVITLGDKMAQKGVLYVGAHNAQGNTGASLLLNFIRDYLEAYERYSQVYQVNLRYLYKMRKIYIVPMINPDGVEYRLRGVSENNPIRERLVAYNGSEDFSAWKFNGRGVDLANNYDICFERSKADENKKYCGEYAESEPEVAALVNFIRFNIDGIESMVSFDGDIKGIAYKSSVNNKHTEHIGRLSARLTNFPLSEIEQKGACGWFSSKFNKPSITVGTLDDAEISAVNYSRLKELLFTFPILF